MIGICSLYQTKEEKIITLLPESFAFQMDVAQVLLSVLFFLVSRSTLPSEATPVNVGDSDVCNTPTCQESAQVLLNSMNTSADPCHDFFQYACGGWIDKHPIPDEKSSYSTLTVLKDHVDQSVAELLKGITGNNHPKPVLQAALLFQSCMDEETRERVGLDPLQDALTFYGGWPAVNPQWSDDGYQWQAQVAAIVRSTVIVTPIMSVVVGADEKESSRHLIILKDPADFGLERKLLLNLTSNERIIEVVAAYKNYIVSTGKLLNPNVDETKLGNDADEIIQFESALAKLSRPKEEKNDPSTLYHKMTVSELEQITENTYFKWTDFLNDVFQDFPLVTDETDINLYEIDYIKNAIKLAHDTDSRVLANYIGWILVSNLGPHATKGFRENKFKFQQELYGTEEQPTLESVCTESVVKLMDFAVGRIYVDLFLTEEERNDVNEIVDDIQSTYENTLDHNTWMDPETKNKAIEKVRYMVNMMGYPSWIKNDEELSNYYSSVPDLNRDEYFASGLKVLTAEAKRLWKDWNLPTHRTTQWVTSPSVVNAYYNPNANTITFPAAILHLPMYKYGRSIALNYGAIGSVIGHEISHGFDNQGSMYDKEGNLRNWWPDDTKEKFDEKTNCFRLQYSSYVEPTLNISLNGNNTIGDDIADNGGVRNSYIAYKMRALELEGEDLMKNRRLPGVPATPDQLFFLGYASAWCGHSRKEALEMEILYGDHTLEEFRVIVPLSNSRAFSEAFSCPLGSRMNPESKCVLW